MVYVCGFVTIIIEKKSFITSFYGFYCIHLSLVVKSSLWFECKYIVINYSNFYCVYNHSVGKDIEKIFSLFSRGGSKKHSAVLDSGFLYIHFLWIIFANISKYLSCFLIFQLLAFGFCYFVIHCLKWHSIIILILNKWRDRCITSGIFLTFK